MVKGNQRKESNSEVTKYVGFTSVEVRAINPTRKELNLLLNKEDTDEDKEIEYLGEDKEGNKRLRLSFWLYSEALDKYFPYSFNITDKVRKSKDEVKTQFVNSVCMTSWADAEENLPNWFTAFLNKEKEEIGKKTFRPALMGEEELATLVRSWLGRLNWNDGDSSVVIDIPSLLKENYTELRSQIDGDFNTPFVILTGVKTDENDQEKQYQQVYGKSFLPNGFLSYIQKNKFPTDYTKKVWARFVEEVEGEYGFNSFYELTAIKAYNKEDDPAINDSVKTDVTPNNSKY